MAVDVRDPAAVERWFVSEGTPTLIRGYSFRRHVLPRALSFLLAFGLAMLVVALGNSADNEFLLLLLMLLPVVVWFGLWRARRARHDGWWSGNGLASLWLEHLHSS